MKITVGVPLDVWRKVTFRESDIPQEFYGATLTRMMDFIQKNPLLLGNDYLELNVHWDVIKNCGTIQSSNGRYLRAEIHDV